MENNDISIPYFITYASDYIVFRGKLNPEEIVEVFDAISDTCLFGGVDFNTENSVQMMFYNKLLVNLQKNIKKYKASIENGKLGGRPKKSRNNEYEDISGEDENPEKTYGFFTGFDLQKPNSKPKQNLNETNIRKEKKREEKKREEKEKKTDLFFDPIIDKCFSIYSNVCTDLPKLNFERRNKEIRELLSEFLFETENDLNYFTSVCKKANKLKTLCNNKLDFKSVIKNHIAIANGKFEKNNSKDVMSQIKFN